jgi:peptidoglycan/LPS O-acetylase OafA/YrhL
VNPGVRERPRLVGLDVLRVLAVILVLGRHIAPPPQTWSNGFRSILLTWQRGGWVGVDLFFVLSGFLVSGLLFSEYQSRGCFSIGRFYARRGWKIYPPFFTLIAATVIVMPLFGELVARRPLASELIFLQSYIPGLWNHTWSLAVEEHFYLLLPLVLVAVHRLNRSSPAPLKPIPALAACVAASALLMRFLNYFSRPVYSDLTHLFASHLRLDSLFFGVAISYAYHFHTRTFMDVLSPSRRRLVIGGALLLTPAFALPLESTPFIWTIGLTLFYIGSGMLVVGILMYDLPATRLNLLLASVGAYSYSVYLWHMPVLRWGIPLIEEVWRISLGYGVRTLVYVIASFVVGIVMAKLIEVPALRLRDRWFPARTRRAYPGSPQP